MFSLFNTQLRKFFEDNIACLESNYPGIKLARLEQEFSLWIKLSIGEADLDLEKCAGIFFEKLKIGLPLEYISGVAYFYKSYFHVNPSVLIPRSETEILVEKSIEYLKEKSKKITDRPLRVAEIGVGPGTISLSMLMEPGLNLDIVAGDISKEALAVALKNYYYLYFRFNTEKHKITFVESDRMSSFSFPKNCDSSSDGHFDLIVSNPPYIKKNNDHSLVHPGVFKYEPHVALFLEDEMYFDWFKLFFEQIYENLVEDGVSWIEGHEAHLDALKDETMKLKLFTRVEVINDYTGRARFLKLTK